MKGHIIINGDYDALKAAIKQIDDINRFSNRSFNYDEGHCRVDYFYDDYDVAEIDYELVSVSNPQIKIEEW